jgi:hypothetical protein
MISPLVKSRLVHEIDLTGLQTDDEFIIEMIQSFESEEGNPLKYITLGQISSFGCEYIAHNVDVIQNLQILQFSENPEDPFSEETKELLINNLKKSKGNLLFCNINFSDSSDVFINPLIELNESLRNRKLEKEEDLLIQSEYGNTVLADISNANLDRLPFSFSDKNYLDSVFGNNLEKSIFEIKNYQEKQRKQKEKILMECSDEPDLELDENIFTSDGFTLLLCKKLIQKFGLKVECDEIYKEKSD